jgi:hypothetical protein
MMLDRSLASTLPPPLKELGDDQIALVRIVVRHCLMPHPRVVASLNGPAFPSIRDQKKRLTIGQVGGRQVLLDDNVTPRWALLWAHGIKNTEHLHGWTFAHVWGLPKDPAAYTNLANLCMMPEFFGSLSDKNGPLCAYLKFHAWSQYGWSPDGTAPPEPVDYQTLDWRYLAPLDEPQAFIVARMVALDNQRVKMLRQLMA